MIGFDKKIEIPFSKGKSILCFIVFIVFMANGICVIIISKATDTRILAISVAGVLLSAFGAIFFLKLIFNKKMGIIINSFGIIDNTSSMSFRRIP
ncbi:MAG: hypothetical protein LBH45_03685, partial [Campylobacteraceae bacterium]|nr:hypothetical protein [Campylobacteraceae bacterium]